MLLLCYCELFVATTVVSQRSALLVSYEVEMWEVDFILYAEPAIIRFGNRSDEEIPEEIVRVFRAINLSSTI